MSIISIFAESINRSNLVFTQYQDLLLTPATTKIMSIAGIFVIVLSSVFLLVGVGIGVQWYSNKTFGSSAPQETNLDQSENREVEVK
ncbi:MAG: hypothetical protein AAFQ80_10940 [Cyanobacteria bacterium J06621_8]